MMHRLVSHAQFKFKQLCFHAKSGRATAELASGGGLAPMMECV